MNEWLNNDKNNNNDDDNDYDEEYSLNWNVTAYFPYVTATMLRKKKKILYHIMDYETLIGTYSPPPLFFSLYNLPFIPPYSLSPLFLAFLLPYLALPFPPSQLPLSASPLPLLSTPPPLPFPVPSPPSPSPLPPSPNLNFFLPLRPPLPPPPSPWSRRRWKVKEWKLPICW